MFIRIVDITHCVPVVHNVFKGKLHMHCKLKYLSPFCWQLLDDRFNYLSSWIYMEHPNISFAFVSVKLDRLIFRGAGLVWHSEFWKKTLSEATEGTVGVFHAHMLAWLNLSRHSSQTRQRFAFPFQQGYLFAGARSCLPVGRELKSCSNWCLQPLI